MLLLVNTTPKYKGLECVRNLRHVKHGAKKGKAKEKKAKLVEKETTSNPVDNVDEAKSSVAVKVMGIRINTSDLKNKSKSQQHLVDVEHEGCYIFIYNFYCFMLLRYFIL